MVDSWCRVDLFVVAKIAHPHDLQRLSLAGTETRHMAKDSRIRWEHYNGRVSPAQTQWGSPHMRAVGEFVIDIGWGQETLALRKTSRLGTQIAVVGKTQSTKTSGSFLRKTFWKSVSDGAPMADRRSLGRLSGRGRELGILVCLLPVALLCVSLKACYTLPVFLEGRHFFLDFLGPLNGVEGRSPSGEFQRRLSPDTVEELLASDVGTKGLDGSEAEK